MTPEAHTKIRVKAILLAAGAYHFMPPANGYGRSGIPDIVCCVSGFFLAIECKAGKGKTTALQDRELEHIRLAGGTALVIYDEEADYTRLRNTLKLLQIRRST